MVSSEKPLLMPPLPGSKGHVWGLTLIEDATRAAVATVAGWS
jgi:hypothetical protein